MTKEEISLNKGQLGKIIIDSERQMYITAKSLLYRDEDCYDAIQNTIVKAYDHIDSLKEDKYAKTWIIRILINECYRILRLRDKNFPLEDFLDIPYVDEEKRDYESLYKAISKLKYDLRVCIILYYFNRKNVKEIAMTLSISEGAVQKRLARARAKLRIALKDDYGE